MSSKLLAAIRREAARYCIRSWPEHEKLKGDHELFEQHYRDVNGFCRLPQRLRGVLLNMVLMQAEAEGVARLRFHYGRSTVFQEIGEKAYEVAVPPSPALWHVSFDLARSCGLQPGESAALDIQYSDLTLHLTVRHVIDDSDPYLEITGFSADPARIAAFSAARPPPRPQLQELGVLDTIEPPQLRWPSLQGVL